MSTFDGARLRQSTVGTWKSCPHKAWLEALVERREREDPGSMAHADPEVCTWLVAGTAFHAWIEEYEREKYLGQQQTADEAEARLRLQLVEDFARVEHESGQPARTWKVAARGVETTEWWLVNGPPLARLYVEDSARHDDEVFVTPDGELAIELPWQAEVFGVPMQGTIDQVRQYPNGDLLIVDPKSGAHVPSDYYQLVVYGAALVSLGWVEPDSIAGVFYNARAGERTREHALARSFERAAKETHEAWAGIHADEPPRAVVSGLCSSCSVRAICEPRRLHVTEAAAARKARLDSGKGSGKGVELDLDALQ